MLVELSTLEAQDQWSEAEGYLREALESNPSFDRLPLVKSRIFAGMVTLWKIQDKEENVRGWATTFGYTEDGIHRVIQIYLGNVDDFNLFVEHQDEFYSWALKNQYSIVEVVGRFGWGRKLKNLGFIHNYTSLIKRLDMELH